MKKLKLQLDDLAVESFNTATTPTATGTVVGNAAAVEPVQAYGAGLVDAEHRLAAAEA